VHPLFSNILLFASLELRMKEHKTSQRVARGDNRDHFSLLDCFVFERKTIVMRESNARIHLSDVIMLHGN